MVLMGSDYEHMKHGEIAPNFTIPATDGKIYSLKDFKGAKALLIVFMCNHCPYVIPKIAELKRITMDYKDKGLVVVGINPNEDKNYPEDSFENMQKLVEEEDINFVYLRDESQEIAKTYGAVCTPDPFLFDSDFKLVFHGRIDDTHGSSPANDHELYRAIGEFLENKEIKVEEKESMGCSIKWKY
ncbi:thioredoxin family protein [archaeon]|nr:thioredoxin family protein [archaeon]MBL7057253.1 thioredoxin family protein [Candidatus Woesearchaeota archaeon]